MKLRLTKQLGAPINKGMFGLFFEDINYGLDGGLHAEMIENRSFEFVQTRGSHHKYEEMFDGLYGWSAYPEQGNGATLAIRSDRPQNEVNSHYLAFTASMAQLAVANKAFEGVCLNNNSTYRVRFYARTEDYAGSIEALVIKDGHVAACVVATPSVSKDWVLYEANLIARHGVTHGTFMLKLERQGTVHFDFISMMPSDAVLGLFRRDLVQWLKEMKPGFLRFPGGCVVEGHSLANRYQWKHSVGQAEERKPLGNRWALRGCAEENEYTGPYSRYNQTLGISYYEYFLLCEYLGAKAIPVVSVGVACQFQSTEMVSVEDPAFQTYIDDVLDLIEFANGPVDSIWGSVRAEMGHPEPFDLEMIGIGNEQWETEKVDFFRRYELFQKAIHQRYPSIKIIGSAGPDVNSDKYEAAWRYYREKSEENPDFVYAVDEHYYVKPEWMFENVNFYDQYPRNIKVFAGEFAAHHSNGMNMPELNNWGAALAEAAFMTASRGMRTLSYWPRTPRFSRGFGMRNGPRI
ncbi:alpha-L-arabinofuranosidase [Cohnella faecalis]|uniref:alpha-L-arabinofuranosidase n=1 Tax=Cohnella faecalis TaxID=2315694 RepID=UPI0013148524|nr:alpha-L-arabinofuranosidase [Cohnella faecalis]